MILNGISQQEIPKFYKMIRLPPLNAQNHVAREQNHSIPVGKHKDLDIRSFRKKKKKNLVCGFRGWLLKDLEVDKSKA